MFKTYNSSCGRFDTGGYLELWLYCINNGFDVCLYEDAIKRYKTLKFGHLYIYRVSKIESIIKDYLSNSGRFKINGSINN